MLFKVESPHQGNEPMISKILLLKLSSLPIKYFQTNKQSHLFKCESDAEGLVSLMKS